MSEHEIRIKLYQTLLDTIKASSFQDDVARRFVATFRRCFSNKKGRKLTLNQIENMWDAVGVMRTEKNIDICMIAKWVFEDFAGQLRHDAARKIVETWRVLAGMHLGEHIFVSVRKVRNLDPDNQIGGPVSVTIVVDSQAGLDKLLDEYQFKRLVVSKDSEV